MGKGGKKFGGRGASSKGFKKKEKLVVTFDAAARRDYLVGFRKRRKERQEKALEDLRRKAREDRIESRREMREAKKESMKRMRASSQANGSGDDDDDDVDDDADEIVASNDDKDKSAISALTGGSATTTTIEVSNDAFTAQAFGSGAVEITTTVAGEESDDEEAPGRGNAKFSGGWGSFRGEKNVKDQNSKAMRRLTKMTTKRSRRGKGTQEAGGKRKGKRKGNGKGKKKKRK